MSALVGFWGASSFWFARRYDEALEESKRVISLDPGFPQGFWVQAAVLSNLGRHGEAVEAAERAVMLSSRQSFFLGVSATTYAAAGRRDEATRILDELSERGRHEYISPLYFADTATALGEFDTAFAWLERACEERVPLLINVGVIDGCDPLRGILAEYYIIVASKHLIVKTSSHLDIIMLRDVRLAACVPLSRSMTTC